MANICFVSLKIECRSKRAALKVNAVLTQLKEAADQQRKGFHAFWPIYFWCCVLCLWERGQHGILGKIGIQWWRGHCSDKVSQRNYSNKIFAAPLWRRRQFGVWRIHLFCRNSFLPETSCFALSRCNRQRFRSGTPATGIWTVWNNKTDSILMTHHEKM